MNAAWGLLETTGLTPAMVALDHMEKAAAIRVVQCELNDFYGVCVKVTGAVAAVTAAVEAGRAVAEAMGGRPVAHVIAAADPAARPALESPPEYNPLIAQDVVFVARASAAAPSSLSSSVPMNPTSLALGFLETQGFTAVFEAIDTACKAANVEVVGKEKLGGGFVTVVIRGELSAVTAAVEAGKARVEGLGKLIAAHVVARPSAGVIALLPKL